MVTVAELAEKYWRHEISNKEFCSKLSALSRKQFDERQVENVLRSLQAQVQELERKEISAGR